jgi:hypothetical protein
MSPTRAAVPAAFESNACVGRTRDVVGGTVVVTGSEEINPFSTRLPVVGT